MERKEKSRGVGGRERKKETELLDGSKSLATTQKIVLRKTHNDKSEFRQHASRKKYTTV